MNRIILEMIVAGIFYGAWPLLLNRSGLQFMAATAVLGISSLALVLSVVLAAGFIIGPKLWSEMLSGFTIVGTKWWLGLMAGCCAGLGTLVFNDGLMKTLKTDAGKMFVTMLIVQTSVPAVYHVIINQQLNIKTAIGFVSALVAIICLI